MPNVALTHHEIDLVAEACDTAVNEHSRFLENDTRRDLARALRAMGKVSEAEAIEPS